MNVMQYQEKNLSYFTEPGAHRSDGKTFFVVFTCIKKEDLAKILKVPRVPRDVNSARAIT